MRKHSKRNPSPNTVQSTAGKQSRNGKAPPYLIASLPPAAAAAEVSVMVFQKQIAKVLALRACGVRTIQARHNHNVSVWIGKEFRVEI